MSDVEGDVPSAAPVASGPMDINTAIQEVLKQALIAEDRWVVVLQDIDEQVNLDDSCASAIE